MLDQLIQDALDREMAREEQKKARKRAEEEQRRVELKEKFLNIISLELPAIAALADGKIVFQNPYKPAWHFAYQGEAYEISLGDPDHMGNSPYEVAHFPPGGSKLAREVARRRAEDDLQDKVLAAIAYLASKKVSHAA